MKKQLNSVSTVDTTIFTDDEEVDGGSGSGGGAIDDDDENYYQRKATISVSPHLPPPPTIIKSKYRFSSALKSFRSRKSSTSSNKLIIRSESEMLSDEEEAEQRQPFLIKYNEGITVGKYIASGRSSTSGKLTDEEQKPRRNKATNLVKKLVGRKPKKITNIEYGRSGGGGGGAGVSGNISGGSGGRSGVGSSSGGGSNTSANTTPGTIKRIPSINLYKNNNNTNINNRSNLSISESSLINIDYNKNSEKSLNNNKLLKKSTSKSLSNDKNIKLLNYNIITNNNEMLSPATIDALQSINHKLEKNKQSYNITQSIIDTWPTTMAPVIPTKLTVTTTTSNQSKTINHKLLNEKPIMNKKLSQQSPAASPRMESKSIQKQLHKNEGIPTTSTTTTTTTAPPTPIPITTGAIRKITKSPTVIRNEIIPIYKTPNNRSVDDGRGRRLPKSFEDQYYHQPHQHYKTQRKTEIGNNLLNPNLSGNIKSSHDNLLKLSNMKLIDDPETTEQDDDDGGGGGGGGEEGEKKSLEFIVAKPKIEFEVGKLVRSPQEQPKQQQLSSTADVDTLSSRSRTSIVISPTLSRTDDYYYSSLDTNKSSERSESSSDPKSDGSSSRRRIAYVPQPSAMIDDIYDEVMKKNLEDQTQPLSSEYSIDSEYSLPPGIDDETIMENGENMATATTSPEKREHLYKILVIGELGAGKTSFIKRYVHQFFSQNYRATIGVDFALKVLNWDQNTIIRLQLWDIAGQERFGNMTRVYYKEAVGAFIVFDVTRSSTFDAVIKWKQDLDSKVQLPNGKPIPCILLANKCDQQKQGLVNTPAKMDEYVKDNGFAGWFETSAKENINIEEAARSLVNKILLNDTLINNGDAADTEKFGLNDRNNTVPKKSCSC